MVNFFNKLEVPKIWLFVFSGALVAGGISLGLFFTPSSYLSSNLSLSIPSAVADLLPQVLGFFGKREAIEKPSLFKPLLKPMVFEPRFVTIEKIGVEKAAVVEVGVEEDGRLEVPENASQVGWYGNGPRAGEEGNAILAGHYDTVYGRPAVFFNLTKLAPGDFVQIEDATTKTYKFEVSTVEYVSINDPESIIKAYEETNDPILTIITCGGVWDPIKHDYNKRLLIKARKV